VNTLVRVALLLAPAVLGFAAPALADRDIPAAYVTRVASGDLIYVEIGGRLEAVHYIGVGVPLVAHPTRPREFYEAFPRELNRRLVEGKWVHLVLEEPARDRFGRLQAYVWVNDLFVNAALIHWGFAEAAPASRHPRYLAYFRSLEAGARQDHRGLWRYGDVLTYHRARGPEGDPDSAEAQEHAAEFAGGQVFSAPAPFIPPLTSGTSSTVPGATSGATTGASGYLPTLQGPGTMPRPGTTYMPTPR